MIKLFENKVKAGEERGFGMWNENVIKVRREVDDYHVLEIFLRTRFRPGSTG